MKGLLQTESREVRSWPRIEVMTFRLKWRDADRLIAAAKIHRNRWKTALNKITRGNWKVGFLQISLKKPAHSIITGYTAHMGGGCKQKLSNKNSFGDCFQGDRLNVLGNMEYRRPVPRTSLAENCSKYEKICPVLLNIKRPKGGQMLRLNFRCKFKHFTKVVRAALLVQKVRRNSEIYYTAGLKQRVIFWTIFQQISLKLDSYYAMDELLLITLLMIFITVPK